MNVKITAESASEPVELSEVKCHIRVVEDEENTYLTGLITAARVHLENYLARSLITKTVELELDDWPDKNIIYLPYSPVTSVESVTYTDEDGDTTTLDAGVDEDYVTDLNSLPARIYPAPGEVWPTDSLTPLAGIKVNYTTGETDIPDPIKHALMMTVAHLHEHREAVYTGYTVITVLPWGLQSLLYPYRVWL